MRLLARRLLYVSVTCTRWLLCARWLLRRRRDAIRSSVGSCWRTTARDASIVLFCTLVVMPLSAHAQAGPPFLTNDPGTPGHGNWEVNLGSAVTGSAGVQAYQVPQIDANLGLGERIQLTLEIPFVAQSNGNQPAHSGWSNAYPGIKWRFLDHGEDGWRASVFPQYETGAPSAARQSGIASDGHRLLLPVQAARRFGPVDVDVEVGCFCFGREPRERIIGAVVGREISSGLELDLEIYDDQAAGGGPAFTSINVGGRYQMAPSAILLFMGGHSVGGITAGSTEYMAYLGVQILLTHFGRSLASGSKHE